MINITNIGKMCSLWMYTYILFTEDVMSTYTYHAYMKYWKADKYIVSKPTMDDTKFLQALGGILKN